MKSLILSAAALTLAATFPTQASEDLAKKHLCTTCHVVVREGFSSLGEIDESEEDLLDRAWGLEPTSRLSCQAILSQQDVTVEIPKYSINHAKEKH